MQNVNRIIAIGALCLLCSSAYADEQKQVITMQCGDIISKAAHYLNIAGRGGEGIGQYGIAYFEISPHLKKGEEPLKGGGYCRDQFILSDELVEMLEDKALRGNAKAAMRLYDFYRHFDEYPVKARAYLTLAAIFGEPRALQILYPVFPLPEGVKPLTFTIPPR